MMVKENKGPNLIIMDQVQKNMNRRSPISIIDIKELQQRKLNLNG